MAAELHSEFKRKEVQLDNLCKTMWRSPQRNAVNYLLCQMRLGYTDVSTWVSCWCRKWNVVKREYQHFFFLIRETSGGENKNYLGKLFSPIESSRNPSKYLRCCYSLFFIICYDQCALSGVSLYSTVLVHNLRRKFRTAWLRKGKVRERKNFVFMTQIIFHMTEGNYLSKKNSVFLM